MARPTLDITPDQVKACAARDMNRKEMAAFLGVSEDTIGRRFADENPYIDSKGRAHEKSFSATFEQAEREGRELGKSAIKAKLYDNAISKGRAAELIFLAKNRIGYTDRQQVDHGGQITHSFTSATFADLSDEKRQARIAELRTKLLTAPQGIDANKVIDVAPVEIAKTRIVKTRPTPQRKWGKKKARKQ